MWNDRLNESVKRILLSSVISMLTVACGGHQGISATPDTPSLHHHRLQAKQGAPPPPPILHNLPPPGPYRRPGPGARDEELVLPRLLEGINHADDRLVPHVHLVHADTLLVGPQKGREGAEGLVNVISIIFGIQMRRKALGKHRSRGGLGSSPAA